MTEALLYHNNVSHLRRTLVQAAMSYEQAVVRNQSRRDDAETDAYAASLMAKGYSYTLAAVLGYAEKEYGVEISHRLASLVDQILMNGDALDLNADVMPPDEES